MSFAPYLPPNEGAGLVTADRDLCWRINPRGLVTPAVIGAVCWARNNFRMSDSQQLAILEGLGLEYHRLPEGGTVLRPKQAYRVALFSNGGEAGSRKPGFPCKTFSLNTPTLPLSQYDAIEVYPCLADDDQVIGLADDDPQAQSKSSFWSVALHLSAGHIETIADLPDREAADTFGEVMRKLVMAARREEGLDVALLQPKTLA